MPNKRILYISRAGIPTDAPGIRIYNIAKVLREIGYKVDFICDREDYLSGEILKTFDGFNYFYNKKNTKITIWQTISNINELIFASRIFNRVKEHCERDKPYAIILYNDVYSLTKKLIRYCKDNDIRLVSDVTEWYGKRKFNGIGDKIVPYLTDKRINKLDRKVKNIISISPYLDNYYSKLRCNSIFIPPIFDIPKNIVINKFNYYSDYVLNLVYAGSPGNKDILNPILDAVAAINKDKIRIRLDLVGIDSNYLKDSWKDTNFDKIAVVAHGRLPHHDTLDIIRKADFGILLRHNKRYAKAGFSTKFAECMANGVAMICNSVGGADLIIDSMNDGIVIDQLDTNEITKTLIRLVDIDKERIMSIRKNAYTKADFMFSNNNYVDKIGYFIKNLREV
jgi:glycosyltransferase involved in cell wall biosynthesis